MKKNTKPEKFIKELQKTLNKYPIDSARIQCVSFTSSMTFIDLIRINNTDLRLSMLDNINMINSNNNIRQSMIIESNLKEVELKQLLKEMKRLSRRHINLFADRVTYICTYSKGIAITFKDHL